MTTNNSINTSLSGQTGTGSFVGSSTPTLTTPILSTVLDTNSNNILTFSAASSAVNYLSFGNAATGVAPSLGAVGTDSNINLGINAKGTGFIALTSNAGNTNMAFVTSVSNSAVNYLTLGNATTGNAPGILAQGSDSNINLSLTGKGTGTIQFGSSGSFTANGSVATVLTSLGPTGSNTTVQSWLTIVDNGGTTRYIPCF